MDNLHVNFSAFVQKAREFVDERDYHLRQRERDIYLRETFIDNLTEKLEDKEKVLDAQLESCERQLNECDKRKKDIEIECKKQREELDRLEERRRTEFKALKENFEMERDKFHSELQVLTDVHFYILAFYRWQLLYFTLYEQIIFFRTLINDRILIIIMNYSTTYISSGCLIF